MVRFFLTNAANARTFNVSFPGARMKVVGSDVGTYEREEWVESVVIAPAERYVVDVRFDRPGQGAMVNRVRALDHLYGRFFAETDTLGIVEVAAGSASATTCAASFGALRRDQRGGRGDRALSAALADGAPEKTLVLTLETQGLPPRDPAADAARLGLLRSGGVERDDADDELASTGRQVRWILREPATGRENMDIDWRFRRGEPVTIRLANQRQSFHAMQHPIHLHGQRFLVLAVNGVPNGIWSGRTPCWCRPAARWIFCSTHRTRAAGWLHCHIAEHLEAGMMMAFNVE